MSVDPLVDETGQPYAYTGDDPVNAVDPSGRITCPKFIPGCGTVTDAQNAISGAVQAAVKAVVDHASEISSVAGVLAVALAPVPGLGEVASPILGAVSVLTGVIATASDVENHQYLEAALDGLGTLLGGGWLAGDALSELTMTAAQEAWDAGEAVLDLAKTSENEEKIAGLLNKLSAGLASVSTAYANLTC